MLKQTEPNGSIKTNNMTNKSITDFIKPTIITAQQYGTKVSVEIDHSDTDIDELMYAFQTICVGLGYADSAWKNWIVDRVDEYKEDTGATYFSVPVNFYTDEVGNKVYDYEGMADQFEEQLSELDRSVVVMVSVERQPIHKELIEAAKKYKKKVKTK